MYSVNNLHCNLHQCKWSNNKC